MTDRIRNNAITEGVIWKQLLKYFFPIVLGTLFQQMYNTVDAIVVGQYVGKEALAAVGGTTGTLINLLVGFFVGLSSGATVVISRFFGAKDEKGVSDSVHTAFALSIAGGLIVTVLGLVFIPMGLGLLNTPPELIADAKLYIRILFAGLLFALIYNMGSGILRAIGDSKRPLYILIVCCVVNIVLDVVTVKYLGMGIAGAAYATVAAQAVSAALVVIILLRSRECYRLIPRRIRFHADILRSIIRIGLPTGLQSMMFTVSNLYIQAAVNRFGTDIIAGWTGVGKVDSLVWMVLDAFGISVTTFAGQNIGAGKMDRVKKAMLQCGAMAVVFCALFSLSMILFGRNIMGLFSQEESVVDSAMLLMRCLYWFYVVYVPIQVISGVLRGAGDTMKPMLMIALGICVFRTIWIFICLRLDTGIETMIYSYGASWILTAAMFVIYYCRGKWRERITLLQRS